MTATWPRVKMLTWHPLDVHEDVPVERREERRTLKPVVVFQ